MDHKEYVYYNVKLVNLQIIVQEDVYNNVQTPLIILHIGKVELVYQIALKLRQRCIMLMNLQEPVSLSVMIINIETQY